MRARVLANNLEMGADSLRRQQKLGVIVIWGCLPGESEFFKCLPPSSGLAAALSVGWAREPGHN